MGNQPMLFSNSSKQNSGFGLQPSDGWLVILGFVLLTSALLVLRQGRILNYGFPAGAFLVGIYLYRKYPVLYFSFTMWVWFLCCLVRRIVDLQAGWTNPSPILLAPSLVSFVSILGICQNLPQIIRDGGFPFLLCGASIVYSFFIGMVSQSPVATIINFLGWFTPISLGLHLFAHWRDYPLFQKNISRTFLWGTLVVGIYGLVQYFFAPEWDTFWMENTYRELGLDSIGKPEPFEIRVFSTLNAPQALGAMLMPGLLLLFTSKSMFRAPAGISGFLSFLLSSARSAWVSWSVGLLAYASSLTIKLQFRLILSFLIGILVLSPLVAIEPFASAITPRVESLFDVKGDGSVQGRAETFNRLLDGALVSFVGKGVGQDGGAGNDQGILVLLFSLGWIGLIPYLIGIALAFLGAIQNPAMKADAFSSSALAIALGSFSQVTTNVATSGILGAMFWTFLGIGMAATKYHKNQLKKILHQSQ